MSQARSAGELRLLTLSDYRKIGLKVGMEVHLQLDTHQKLFCGCSAAMREKESLTTIERRLHPVESELGEFDHAAQFEYLKNRVFHYQAFAKESCLVELDCEPIHQLNEEALDVGLQIAMLFNCQIPAEIQVMRKTVIDGSNTSGFQRTAIIGLDGHMDYKGKEIPITQVVLEEDAAAIVKEENGSVTYRLNRLGVPLVEVSTGTIGLEPGDAQEIAYLIGMTCRSTGKLRRGIGSIRQDVNVSISKGARVEIKGVQELGMIAKVIENEARRQTEGSAKEETRAALPDGTTKFMRPLPGASRMYPETDIPPVIVIPKHLADIKKSLPEPLPQKLKRFETQFKLSQQLAKEILRSEYLDVFEKIKGVEPSVVASTFTSVVKDLEKREHIPVENVTEQHFVELFENLAKKKIVKESFADIIKFIAQRPDKSVADAIKELHLQPMSDEELKKVIQSIVAQPDITADRAIGLAMARLRGKADANAVIKLIKQMIK